MNSNFPLAKPNKPGYRQSQVDAFIEAAREQYADFNKELLTFDGIRNAAFDLVRGGYEISAVDSAIDRLEDAFAAREIDRQKLYRGDQAIRDWILRLAKIVHGRTSRPSGKKFSKVRFPMRGYDRKQVDALCDWIEEHLRTGLEIKLDDVRRASFKVKRRGYSEAQVDAFIDRVVEVLQLEKNR